MDLSGIIFAGLAVAWAVYLIPKALRHHDEMAKSRSVDRFSHTMRVLGRHGATGSRPEPRQVVKPPAPQATASSEEPRKRATKEPRQVRHAVTRATARRAAARRRRVLGVLLLAVAVLAVLAWRAIVPWWSVAVPGGMVLVFLVVARVTVRRQQSRIGAHASVPASVSGAEPAAEAEDDREDTVGVDREELAAAVAAPLADEGSLWDPLPLTLPTYVNKARARRTVRTIELTEAAGVTSSGHDVADSALVAAAAETADGSAAEEPVEQRKVAGA